MEVTDTHQRPACSRCSCERRFIYELNKLVRRVTLFRQYGGHPGTQTGSNLHKSPH